MNSFTSRTSVVTDYPAQPKNKLPYSERFVWYTKNYLPKIEPILSFIANQSPLCETYPISKLLKAMSRMLLLNEIETIFLANVIKLTQWNFNHPIINKYKYVIFPFIFYDTSLKIDAHLDPNTKEKIKYQNKDREFQFKKLSLYILLVGYYAKYFLIDQKKQIQEYLKEITRYCIDFEVVFKDWANKQKQISMVFNPKNLNEISIKVKELSQKDQLNHNLTTDLILQLSPAYNAQDINHQNNRMHE